MKESFSMRLAFRTDEIADAVNNTGVKVDNQVSC